MKPHAYRLVNVFTHGNDRFSGNPLCVFEDGAGLSDEVMQALARQFSLSETTFILPPAAESPAPEDPEATALVRIFTPSYEMPFAGHPTLGTAQVCRSLGLGNDDLRLRMQAGSIPVSAKGNRWTLTARTGTAREVDESRADLAAGLGLDETDIGERPLWVDSGSEQLIVPLASESAVRQAVLAAGFIAHTTQARETTEQEFFNRVESGGTLVSSAYELAQRLQREHYPATDWNVYVLHASDGENFLPDNDRVLDAVVGLMDVCALIGYPPARLTVRPAYDIFLVVLIPLACLAVGAILMRRVLVQKA